MPDGLDASDLAGAIPSAESATIPGAAHWPNAARDRGVVHDELRTLIANFLKRALGVRTGGG